MNLTLPETCTAETVAALWRSRMPEVARLARGDTLTLDAETVAT